MMKTVRLILVLTFAAACTFGPTAGVPIAANGWGEYSLLLHDASGIVTGLRGGGVPPAGRDGAVAVPERSEVEVRWTGGACSHQPVLEVAGSANDLRMVIRNPHDPQPLPFLPISCPAVGVPLGVVLVLSEPVAQNAIQLEVMY